MRTTRTPITPITQVQLEARIREVAQRLFAGERVDELETWHLARVVEHCSRAISDVYRRVNLHQILEGRVHRPPSLEDLLAEPPSRLRRSFHRVTRVPEDMKGVGDRCLYDIGMAGVRDYRGVNLEALGIRAYQMAAEILSILADDRDLKELFHRNRMRTLPIEEEIAFLRQCAARFNLYESLLMSLWEADTVSSTSGALHRPASDPIERLPPPPAESLSMTGETRGHGVLQEVPQLSADREPRARVLSRYERILLFAETDIEAVRRELKTLVIDQGEAVDILCDDLLLNATGTQVHGVPQSYFFVGPTGVGKNYLLESLARVLERIWQIKIPFLVIEGPQYTYPSDINELKGATRGFIRSDEVGLLTEFHERSSQAPLAILVVDEVEKGHAQLQRFFLSVMDRGTTLDNRGQELSFEGSILAFTSNLGFSFRAPGAGPIGYRSGPRGRSEGQEDSDRHLRRSLSPEFMARLRTVRFFPLSQGSIEAILGLELAKVLERFRLLHGLEVRVTDPARRRLMEIGFSATEGARHLAAVIRRHCNVEVSRRIKKDELPSSRGRTETIRYLREIRRGDRAFEAPVVERTILDQARVRLPYRRLIIDVCDGEFRYAGEDPA